MLRQVSAIALLLATQMAGGAVQLPFVAAVQAEETAIDIWRAFEMLDAESTQAEGLALVQQAAEAGNAPAMGRLGKITIHGDYGVPVDRDEEHLVGVGDGDHECRRVRQHDDAVDAGVAVGAHDLVFDHADPAVLVVSA